MTLPEHKLNEDDYKYWSTVLEQQKYWKEQFLKQECHLSMKNREKFRSLWNDHYVNAKQVSEILHQYKQMQRNKACNFGFFFFSFFVICVLLTIIYIN